MQIQSVTTLNIHIPQNFSPEALAALEKRMGTIGRAPTQETASPTPADHPAIGDYWAGQGGIYIATLPALHHLPTRHLILSTEEKDELT